jgi:hypothetical protein
MGLFSGKPADSKANRAEYRKAKASLERINRRDKARGVRAETAEWTRANRRVAKAADKLPWWQR